MPSGLLPYRPSLGLLLAGMLSLGACQHDSQSDPSATTLDASPVPSVSAVSPTSAAAGSPTLTLEVTGSDFVGTSVINWNGTPLATGFISDTVLTATLPATELTSTGTASVTVVTPPPGGGTSAALTFAIIADNPAPSINSLSPASAAAGSPALVLSVNGSDFVPAATVQWNGSQLATSFVSATQLTATLPASDIASAGSASVTVVNPAPGGGTSAGATFRVTATNPLPSISALSPASAASGSPQLTLTVSGSDFVASSTVQWNGSALATTFVDASTLTAVVPVGDLATIGSASVTVATPAPGGGTSNSDVFTITPSNPPPSLSSIAPSSAAAGSTAVTLTINGSDFVAASTVRWNGGPLTTTFVNAAKLTALVPASDLASAGTVSVTVFNPTPGGGTSGSASFAITTSNPAPSLSALTPGSAAAGSPAVQLQVGGSGFIDASVVRWNGNNLTTSYVSAAQLTALVPASDLAAAGSASVTVVNPAPGGGTSSADTFTILATNPPPSLSSISPTSAAAGNAALTLTVSGSNFVADSKVDWNGTALTTTFVSSTRLTALVPASDLAAAGSASVTVVTPSPGGGSSGAVTFAINTTNPAPSLSAISPTSAAAGSTALTLTVTGSDFVAASAIAWNGTALTTTFVSSTQLTALVPASDLTTAGNGSVTVVTAPPGGGTSGTATFTINAVNPAPSLGTISPASATAGSNAITLTVTGSDFVAASEVDWNGTALNTTYVSAAQLTATIPASDLATTGTASVTVVNPAPGGGTSGALTFTINPSNPLPTLSALSPPSALAGATGFTLTVTGGGFVAGASVVQWNGTALATTYVSASQLTAAVPASDIASAGSASVTVVNPTPGGGTSGAISFSITATNPVPALAALSPASASVNSPALSLTLTGSGFISSSVVQWNGSALATTYLSPTQLTATIPASDLASVSSANVTVANPAPGGGTSTAAAFSVTAASSGNAAVRQVQSLTGGQTHSGGVLLSPWSVPITVLQGSALWVVGTVPVADDICGVPNYQYPNINVSDGTNTYTLAARVNDPNTLSDGIEGTQAFVSWVALNVPAGTYTVSMLPGCGSTAISEDWVAVAVVEITGVSQFDVASSSLPTQVPPGTNSVTATATSTSANSFLIAATFDDESSGTNAGTPVAGTGFTDQGSYWPLVTAGGNSLRIESKALPTAGSQSASFSPTEGKDSQGRYPDYPTLMAIFH
jgi:hypothetical protein